ncbi:hypothetical protein CANCADRAFT_579 [Tortispora caseinolytica NRRL Y-17796]|uniref:Uncharacterized protein n=1 Tax=Tortispora caseinolytica NRRL Y-17796 TaxID=767744 RepID=A0A1E4TJQ8_9ASCO|nr:hypothetical protein CANCADRAFT_579 [Tortispora caseinolytica NRRL Y-17796]
MSQSFEYVPRTTHIESLPAAPRPIAPSRGQIKPRNESLRLTTRPLNKTVPVQSPKKHDSLEALLSLIELYETKVLTPVANPPQPSIENKKSTACCESPLSPHGKSYSNASPSPMTFENQNHTNTASPKYGPETICSTDYQDSTLSMSSSSRTSSQIEYGWPVLPPQCSAITMHSTSPSVSDRPCFSPTANTFGSHSTPSKQYDTDSSSTRRPSTTTSYNSDSFSQISTISSMHIVSPEVARRISSVSGVEKVRKKVLGY